MWRRSATPVMALAALAGVTALDTRARAETVEATSTTLLVGRGDPRDGVVHTVVPLFELVSVQATDLRLRGFDELTVVLAGWGEVSFADPLEGRRGTGDVDVGFVEGKLWHRRVLLRLGRQLVMSGAARNLQLDGLTATVRLWRWLGASAQAGAPVTPRFGVDRGDAMVAGRLFVKPSFDAEAGVSLLHLLDDGLVARQDLALDARLVLLRTLAVSGFARWSLVEERLAEGDVGVTFQPLPRLELTADYRRLAPDLFLPRNSIFSVFAQETRDEAGGYLYARLAPRLRLQGEYHAVVDDAGTGHDGAGKLTATLGRDRPSAVGVESRRLALAQGQGYLMARAFASLRLLPELFGTLDASSFFFDAAVNGQPRSFVGAATLAWDVAADWRAVVTGVGSVTPFAERRFEGMAKLVWRLRLHTREVRP